MTTMNWIREIIGTKESRQVQVSEPTDLRTILNTDVNLAYYKRERDQHMEQYIMWLIRHSTKGIDMVVNRRELEGAIANQMNDVGPGNIGKIKMEEDIIKLASLFFEITGAPNLRLILKIVSDDACRKFHTDAYDLRLLCTYSGRGTEWIEDRFVNRRKLFHGENEDIIKDNSKVRRMEPFEVAILKGEISSRPKGKGIVHRSPPIQQAGEKRLLLRIDH